MLTRCVEVTVAYDQRSAANGMCSFRPLSFWDDELESLSNAVIIAFGEQAISDAASRATRRCFREIDPTAPPEAVELSRRLAAAIKVEFRRLLTPQ